MRSVARWAKAWNERRKQRAEERADRDPLVRYWGGGGQGLAPEDRKTIRKPRRRKAVA